MKSLLCVLILSFAAANAFSCSGFNSLVNVSNSYTFARGFVHPLCNATAFDYNQRFVLGTESGSSYALYYKGCKVVDLWGGNRTLAGDPWQANTLSKTFSTAKGLLAFALAKSIELTGSRVKWNDLVTEYWPEFGQNGKSGVTLEILASHRAGVFAMNSLYTAANTLDRTFMDNLAAETFPAWNPDGSLAGYHPVSIGHFVDALVRRVHPYGKNIEEVLTETFIGLQGAEDVEFYYRPSSSLDSRVAHLRNETFRAISNGFIAAFCASPLYQAYCRALASPVDTNFDVFSSNNVSYRGITYEPASDVWTNARSVANIYGLLSFAGSRNSLKILKNLNFKDAIEEVYRGPDVGTFALGSYTRAGWEYPVPTDAFSTWGGNSTNPLSTTSFGRSGLCGNQGFGDTYYQAGFSYMTSNCYWEENPNTVAMMESAKTCLNNLVAAGL